MDTLNYEVLAKSGYNGYILKNAPEKVLQFGEGNFLRAFVDYWFDLANEKADWNGKCVLVQPIAPGLAKMINEQEGLYTLGQLAGEAGCGHVLQLAGGVVDDACLGGVGNDDLKIVAGGNVHHLLKALLLIRVQAAGDAGDNALVIDLFAVFTAAHQICLC